MTVSSTEGKTFIGIVVAGDDTLPDPYAMGRVKVLCPSLHHPSINIADLPWCFMASQPDNIGGFSYNRPPPLGSIVEIFYSPGTKSTGQGMIRSVINGVHNPHSMTPEAAPGSESMPVPQYKPPGFDLSSRGYYATARYQTPTKHSGPVIRKQEDGCVGGKIQYGPYPAMWMRDGIDSSLANKGFVRTNFKIKAITRAQQFAACIYDNTDENISETPKLEAIGKNIDASQWIDYVTSRMADQFLKMGARNYGKNLRIKYSTSKKNYNFVYCGPLTYDIGWRLKTLNKFTTEVINQKTLQDTLWEMETSEYLSSAMNCTSAIPSVISEPMWEQQIIQDESNCEPPQPKNDKVEHEINDSPISRTLEKDGTFKVETDEELGPKLTKDQKRGLDGNKLNSIEYAGGKGWMKDTDIGNLILRLQLSAQLGIPTIRKRAYPLQRHINKTYKTFKFDTKIDRGGAPADDEGG